MKRQPQKKKKANVIKRIFQKNHRKKADKKDNRHRSSASNIKADTAKQEENTAHTKTRKTKNCEKRTFRRKEIKFKISA